jgi:hypothetical protein
VPTLIINKSNRMIKIKVECHLATLQEVDNDEISVDENDY